MSWSLLPLVQKARLQSHVAKLILYELVDCSNDDGGSVFPTVGRVARHAQCSERTVQRVFRDFMAVGLLRRVRQGGQGPGTANHYALDLGILQRLSRDGWEAVAGTGSVMANDGDDDSDLGSDEAFDASEPAAHSEQSACENPSSHAEKKGVTQSPFPRGAKKGDAGDTHKGDTAVSPNPLIENPLNQRERRASEREEEGGLPETASHAEPEGLGGDAASDGAGAGEGDAPAFEAFRKGWPSAIADSERQMLAAWAELTASQKRAALDGIRPFLDECRRLGRKHVISGVTYLRERKWTLVEGLRREASSAAFVIAKPWSRLWWARMHLAMAGKLRRADGRAVSPSLMLLMAQRGTGDTMLEQEAAAAREDRLRPVPARSDEARAFVADATRRGLHFPTFSENQWIFLPPADAAQGLREAGGL